VRHDVIGAVASSIPGLKMATCCRAICALRILRISSSVLPLNMQPAMTSIHPVFCGESWAVGAVIVPGS